MQTINLADVKTYALMNNISEKEAKRLVGEQINGTSNAFSEKVEENNFTDNFISTTKSNVKSVKEELSYYENFFANNNKEEQVSSEIETISRNPQIMGKTASEIAKFFASELDIFEEDAAEIFTEDFINDVLGIETPQESQDKEPAVDEEEIAAV